MVNTVAEEKINAHSGTITNRDTISSAGKSNPYTNDHSNAVTHSASLNFGELFPSATLQLVQQFFVDVVKTTVAENDNNVLFF